MIKVGPYLLIFLLLSSVVIADTASDFEHVFAESVQLNDNTKDNLRDFKPQQAFENYTITPAQSAHYQDVKEYTPELEAKAIEASKNDEAGKMITASNAQRLQFKIDANDELLKKSRFIEDNATDIARGKSNKYIDCQQQAPVCYTEYLTKTCNEPAHLMEESCFKTLKVTIDHPQEQVIQNTTVRVSYGSYGGVIIRAHLLTGQLEVQGAPELHWWEGNISPFLHLPNCNGVVYVNVLEQGDWYGYPTEIREMPSCNNDFTATLFGPYGRWHHQSDKVGFTFQFISYLPPVASTHWEDTCVLLEDKTRQGICYVKQQDYCIEPQETRVADGVSVTANCWKMQSNYSCGLASSDNNCGVLQQQSCSQSDSTCALKVGDICAVLNQTYQCPIKHCEENAGIICGEESYCMEGDCTDHSAKPNKDFEKAAAGLAAVSEAAKEFAEKNKDDPTHRIPIFTGKAMECSEIVAGASNCCKDTGWLHDIGLFNCSEEEKELGKAKEERHVAVKVGRYCVGKLCLEHKQSYCVFDSKIARIIQEKGRRDQLHISFGKAKHPNCRGITAEELAQMHFTEMNFEEIYDDVKNQVKAIDTAALEQKIKDKITAMHERATPWST